MGVARMAVWIVEITGAYHVAVGRLGQTLQTLQTSQTFKLPTVSGNGRGLFE